MSKIALEGNASGTGTFTIASPNSNSNYTLNLPTSSGTVVVTGGAQTIEFAAGTASAPSITTTGDTNTGIFFPAADTIAFTEGGVESMRIDSSGRLFVNNTSAISSNGLIQSGSTNATTISNTYIWNSSDKGIALKNDSNTTNSAIGLSMFGGSGGNSVAAVLMVQETNNSLGALAFYTGGSGRSNTVPEAMRIDSSGNVGIGVSFLASPSGSRRGLQVSNSTNGGILFLGNSTTESDNPRIFGAVTNSTDLGFAAGGSTGYINWYTNGTERARITSGGYFKASNAGTYNDSTGAYHELRQTANQTGVVVTATDSNYSENGSGIFGISSTRSANSAFTIAGWYSGAFSDREFQFRGDGNGYADGTWNNNGADYAEFFESANGQALTLGATVVLDGNKVREATDQDPASAIIGVVRPKEPSKASMVVGNTAWNKWANKYLTDDFDRYIMEDHDVVEWEEIITDEEGKTSTKQHSYESHNIPAGITVPTDATIKTHDDKGNKFQHYKLNPAWDKDAEYVNRENRPEWNIIGLLGQVKILKGQPVGDRWTKMRDVSATVEEWMIR